MKKKILSKKNIANKIRAILAQLYPEPKVPLHHSDPYSLLVAVVLSANCTDKQVNRVTPALFLGVNDPKDMLGKSIDEIESIIHPCGLGKQKAKHIWQLSKILVDRYQGEVPDSFEALESLPGVGHKTASVVMSQAFHQAAFPVDTHIHRCAERWGLSNGKSVKQTEKDLKALFPKNEWNLTHLRIIYFAREYCQARKHDVELCPICSWLS